MANACRGLQGHGGRWSSFTLVYDKEPGTAVPRGTIEVDVHTGNTITGRRRDGPTTVEFEGRCRNRTGRPTVMSFEMVLDGARFFFSGTIQTPNSTSSFIEGAFFVLERVTREPKEDTPTTDESSRTTAPPAAKSCPRRWS